jgi:hypothetical protein
VLRASDGCARAAGIPVMPVEEEASGGSARGIAAMSPQVRVLETRQDDNRIKIKIKIRNATDQISPCSRLPF